MAAIHLAPRAYTALWLCLALAMGLVNATPAGPALAGDDAWHLDDSFGEGGEVTTKFGTGFDEIFDIAIDPDGKVVAVGDATLNGFSDFAVARYKENGDPDDTFGGGDGMVTTDFAGDDDYARGVAIASDGRIVVVGSQDNPTTGRPRIALAIYSSNGSPIDTIQYEQFGISQATSVAIYRPGNPHAGKIVLAGYSRDANNIGQFIVVRLSSDGLTLDTAFNGTGSVKLPLQTAGHNVANAVRIQSDGKIVVAGTINQEEFKVVGDTIGLNRLKANGNPDTAFGFLGNGWVKTPCTSCAGWGLGIRADGAIYVAGQNTFQPADGGVNMTGWRYTSAGMAKAILGADFFGRIDVAREVVFQPGKMVLVGWTAETGDGSSTSHLIHFALARFTNSPEAVDKTFGPNNSYKLLAGFAYGYDAALSAAVTSEGDIVAAGGSNQAPQNGTDMDFALARFTGPTGNFPGFSAEVYELKPFTLKAAPDSFRVFWRSEGEPAFGVKFDVRSREARYDDTKLGPWRTIATKTNATSKTVKIPAGRTVCFQVRGRSQGFTTPWSKSECTAVPVDDRTLDKQPRSAWGSYSRSDCYRNTYVGNGGGTGAILHLEAAFKQLAVIVAKGPGFGTLKVFVDGTAVKTISLQGSAIKCGVLVPVKTYQTAPRRDVDIQVIEAGTVGNFVDGIGTSLI